MYTRQSSPSTGAGRGGGYAVLPRAGLGDDAPLAHALGQQSLAQRVVDLVRPGVGQVLPLEVDASAAELPRQVLGEVQRRGPPYVGLEIVGKPGLKSVVLPGGLIRRLQLLQGGHECFRDESTPVDAEVPPGVRQ